MADGHFIRSLTEANRRDASKEMQINITFSRKEGNNMKKLLSAILALAMAAVLLPATAMALQATSVSVGGVELTNGTYLVNGGTAATTDAPASGTGYAYFDNSSGNPILTLNGAVIGNARDVPNAKFMASIYFYGDLTIKLIGTNTITGFKTTGDYTSYGIYADHGSITFEKNTSDTMDTLTVTGGISQSFSAAIYADSNYSITFNGGTVNATGGSVTASIEDATNRYSKYYYSYGIYNNGGKVYVTGGTVSVTGETVSCTATDGDRGTYSYGVMCNEVNIRGGIFNATGGAANTGVSSSAAATAYSVGVGCVSLTISDGTLTAIGKTATATDGSKVYIGSCGIFSNDTTISGGTLTATGNTTTINGTGEVKFNAGYGIYGSTTVTGGTTVATGNTSAISEFAGEATNVTVTGHNDYNQTELTAATWDSTLSNYKIGTATAAAKTLKLVAICSYTAPAPITENGVTATVTFTPASPQAAGTSVTATVTLTGTAATSAVHSVDLTSAKADLTTSPKTQAVTANQNLTATPVTKTFTFTLPAKNVDDLVLTHTFCPAAPECTFSLNGTNAGKLMGSTTLMEYSLDGGTTWTDCTADMALTVSSISAASDIKVRVKAAGTVSAGLIKTIDVTKASTPNLTATQPTAIDGKGSIPMTTVHEYKLSTDTAWTAATGTAELAAGTYQVRVKATGTVLASDAQTLTITAFDPAKEVTPSVTFTATGPDSGTLSGVSVGLKYSTDGTSWTDVTSPTDIDLTGLSACTLSVVKKGDGMTTADSVAQTIAITKADTPTAVGVACTTSANKDGKLTGVSDSMEYQLAGDTGWTPCGGTEVTGLASGKYSVRVKATGATLASDTQEVTVSDYSAPHSTDDKEDYTSPANTIIYNDPVISAATVWLTGSDLPYGDLLITDKLTSGDDYDAMLKLADKDDIFKVYNIYLRSGRKSTGSAMYLNFDLADRYAGQAFTLVHKKADDTLEYFYATADSKGDLKFGPLYELSPFMLVEGTLTQGINYQSIAIPQTSDSTASGLWIGIGMMSLLAMGGAICVIRRRKQA